MVNAKEWLDEIYTTREEKNRVYALYLNELNLKEELDLTDFTELHKIYIPQSLENSLNFKNNPCEIEVVKYIKAQEWLDERYPKNSTCEEEDNFNHHNYGEKRGEIEVLDISSKNLIGELDLSDFTNLTTLYCSHNFLTNINLGSNVKLEIIRITNNNFSEQNLSIFSKFVNLNELCIGNNDQDRIKQGIYNRFVDSLSYYLQVMNKLRLVDIRNTNLNIDLSCLPNSVEKLICDFRYLNQKSWDELKKYFGKYYDIFFHKEGLYKHELIYVGKWRKDLNNFLDESEELKKDVRKFFGSWSWQEVKELKDPRQIESLKNVFFYAKWGLRTIPMVGGTLSAIGGAKKIADYSLAGGLVTLFYAPIEAFLSYKEDQLVKSNESKWETFVKDSKKLWSNYREVLETLQPFEHENNLMRKEFAEHNSYWIEQITKKNKKFRYILEKINKIPRENGNSSAITKNQFAQDLRKNWEDRERQWEKIIKTLAELSKAHPLELINNNLDNNISKKNSLNKNSQEQAAAHLIIDIDLNGLDKNNVQHQTRTQIVSLQDQTIANISSDHILQQKKELSHLIESAKAKMSNPVLKQNFNKLLNLQKELVNNGSITNALLETLKNSLAINSSLSREEINHLCQLQREVTQLERQSEQQYQTKIEPLTEQ